MALRLKANRRFPSIPVVVDTAENHTQVLMAVKEALDIGQRRTGDLLNSFIRVEDLIDLGLITIEGNTNSIVGADLSEIADIGDLSGAAAGDFLRFDGSVWINDQLATGDITQSMVTQHQAALSIAYSQITGAPSVPSDLDDLTDVTITAPALNDVLTFDGSQWVPAASQGGGSPPFLDDLADVDAPYPDAGDVLTWDGYGWVNDAPPGAASAGGVAYSDGTAVSGNTVASSTVETAFTSSYSIPVVDLIKGAVIRGNLYGVYGTTSTPTLRFKMKLQGTTLLDSTAFNTPSSVTNVGWHLEWVGIVTLAGASGKIEVQGRLTLYSGAGTAQVYHLSNTAAITVDMSFNAPMTVTVQWGTSSSSNTITCRTFVIEVDHTEFVAPPSSVTLLHFNGSNASTTITDESGRTWTVAGNAQLSTAQKQFGTASLLLDGTGDWVNATADAVYAFGTNDFTIECFVRYIARSGNNFVLCFGGGWGVYTFSGQWAVFDGVSSNPILGGSVVDGQFYHIALVRQGNSLKLFIDGTLLGSATNTTNHTGTNFRIGAQLSGSGAMNGYVDEMRISTTARYTANFTPPTGEFAYPS